MENKSKFQQAVQKAASVAFTVHISLTPVKAYAAQVDQAASDANFGKVVTALLQIADWLCVGVIMFSGALWMFGNRTKSIEHLLGAASGYLIIRKAEIIRDFLRGL